MILTSKCPKRPTTTIFGRKPRFSRVDLTILEAVLIEVAKSILYRSPYKLTSLGLFRFKKNTVGWGGGAGGTTKKRLQNKNTILFFIIIFLILTKPIEKTGLLTSS